VIAVTQDYEYMFCPSFIVDPVTDEGITESEVYLPKDTKWVDFWTGKGFNGPQTVKQIAGFLNSSLC
jgi:alpha-D-xyloside xylohydrolase